MDSYAKKRKPNYSGYKPNQRSKYTRSIMQGMSGFLCTCNFREKDCIRESYNLLNEYADLLYGDSTKTTPESAGPVAEGQSAEAEKHEEDDDDIQSSLSKEIASLKADGKKSRFQVLESGAKNCLFIKTTLSDPVALVHHIVQDLEQKKKQKTRFLLRLLPIEITCNANLDDIAVYATPLIEKYFTAEGKSFSVVFNSRNNSGINRDKVIDLLAQLVSAQNPANRVDLKQPQLSVLVEVIRSMCCISVLPDYHRFRRYNLLEITGVDKAEQSVNKVEQSVDKADQSIDKAEQSIDKADDDDKESDLENVKDVKEETNADKGEGKSGSEGTSASDVV